jgi:hypothetical protein
LTASLAVRPALEPRAEILAVEPLHGEEQLTALRLAVSDVADDAGVGELGEQLDLAHEARGVLPARVGEDLEGHGLARGAIPAFPAVPATVVVAPVAVILWMAELEVSAT